MPVGKREKEGQGTYLGPWLEQGGGGAGRPREAGAAAALLRRGGGCAAVEVVVELEGAARGPLYRPSKAVGRAVGRWPRCGRTASFAGAINGVWPLASIAEQRTGGEAVSG